MNVQLQIKSSSWSPNWDLDKTYYGLSGYREALSLFEKALDDGKVAILTAPDRNKY